MSNSETIIGQISERFPPEIVIFIGAGASVEFGMPLMSGFFGKYFNDYNPEHLKSLASSANLTDDNLLALFILDYAEKYNAIKKGEFEVDLENLLNYIIECQNSIKKKDNIKNSNLLNILNLAVLSRYGLGTDIKTELLDIWNDFKLKVDSLINTLLMRLYTVYNINFENVNLCNTIVGRYEMFFRHLLERETIKGNIYIFTTNYDPCLDLFFKMGDSNYNRTFVDGIHKVSGSRFWDLSNYIPNTQSTIIALFNLHGSILWTKSNGRIYKRKLDESNMMDSVDKISLIPPYIKKPDKPPFKEMYDFYNLICSNEQLRYYISIGYSFRDEEIRKNTADGLNKNKSKILHINHGGINYDELLEMYDGSKMKRIEILQEKFDNTMILGPIRKFVS